MSQPLVTVLIPSYNHAAYVNAAIESVLRQTYKNIELIIIDDYSGDGSREVIGAYEGRDGITVIYNEKNVGLTKNMNKALELGRGKYFCMLSSDDIWFDNKLEKIIPCMEGRPDIVCCGASHIVIDEAGRCERRQRINPHLELDFDDIFLKRKEAGPSAATTTFRMDVLKQVGGYDENIALEDLDIWLKITRGGGRIVCLNDVLAYYRKHPENTSKKNWLMYQSVVAIWSKYRDHPLFERAINLQRKSFFIRACKRDKSIAWKILRDIPVRQYDGRILRGILKYFGLPS